MNSKLINSILGSHDSGTFDISPASDVAPDAEPILQILSVLGCVVKEILTQWSLTQYYTIRQQLYRGIRYFDFRIATKKSKDLFYFVHGLYSEEVIVELEEIKDFLEQHPKEIVILDCQHFYGLETYDHKRFVHLLGTVFGEKLLPYSSDMKNITLDSMSEDQRQVIVIYRESPPGVVNPFWPSQSFPNPWGDKIVASNLIDYLNEQLKLRDYSLGYVSQCILTPSASYILRHLCSKYESKVTTSFNVDFKVICTVNVFYLWKKKSMSG